MEEEPSPFGIALKPQRVIYIGLEGAHILRVTRDALEYVDRTSESHLLDLKKCVTNWCRYFDLHGSEFFTFPGVTEEDLHAENATMVAMRGTRYLQFFDDGRTRFEFRSDDERWRLQGALSRVGWKTFDME